MNKSESITNLCKSLSAFQSEVKQPKKSGVNPHFRSKYVTLDDTIEAINKFAPKHGLSYTQIPVTSEIGVGVITVVMHESGEYIEFEPFTLPLDKKNAQGSGSALTYARRYALSSAFGIASDEDDDGNGASVQDNTSKNNQKQKTQQNKGNSNQKSNQTPPPPPPTGAITGDSIGLIKVLCGKVAELRGTDVMDSYLVITGGNKDFKVSDLETWSEAQGKNAISTLERWLTKIQGQPTV